MRYPIPGDSPGIDMLEYVRPYLRHCGASLRPAWRMSERKLLDFLLVYIRSGRGCFRIDHLREEVEADDLFWVPPDTVHAMEGFPPSMYCVYLHFDVTYRPVYSHWDFSIPAGMCDLSELAPLLHPPLPPGRVRDLRGRLRGTTNSTVGRLMEQAVETAMTGHAYAGVRASGLLTEIIAEILRGRQGLSHEYAGQIAGLDRAAEYLREHCAHPIKLAEAAEIAGLSESHFRKLFGVHYGCSPREYLRRRRIQRAKQLMMSSASTLTHIADACGFATVHSFSRAFRACEGISPAEYRRTTRPVIRVEGTPTPYPW
jgi:AraC-like DNA-binding protein